MYTDGEVIAGGFTRRLHSGEIEKCCQYAGKMTFFDRVIQNRNGIIRKVIMQKQNFLGCAEKPKLIDLVRHKTRVLHLAKTTEKAYVICAGSTGSGTNFG